MAVTPLTDDTGLPAWNQWLHEHRHDRLCLDTETNGLWPWMTQGWDATAAHQPRSPFRCTHIAIAAHDGTAWVIDGSNRALCRRVLQSLTDPDRQTRIWAHNAEFDVNVLTHAFGVHIPLLDSMTLVKALRPGWKSYSLKTLRPDTEKAKDRLHHHYRELFPLDFTIPNPADKNAVTVHKTLLKRIDTYLIPRLAATDPFGFDTSTGSTHWREKTSETRKLLNTQPPADRIAVAVQEAGWYTELAVAIDETGWLAHAFEALTFDDPYTLDYVATDAIETSQLVGDMATTYPPGIAALPDQTDRDTAHASALDAALIEVQVQRMWSAATARGYRLDTELLDQLDTELTEIKEQSIRTHGFDMTTNNNALREWIAGHGISITDTNGKDTLSSDYYDRAKVPDNATEAWNEFLHVKEVAAKNNFLTGMKKNAAGGRIYPRILGIGTHTGRSASQYPNLQNIAPDVRGVFLADEGHILLGADFDSVEPRVMAALSQDPAALAAVQGGDVYTDLAVQVWGDDARGNKDMRKRAKVVFLAVGYGQSAGRTSEALNIPVPEAQKVLDSFRQAFPVLAKWSQRMVRETEQGSYFFTGFGRPLPRPKDVDPMFPRVYTRAVNWRVQGTAACALKRQTIRIAEALGPQVLWLPIHDEVILQVPDTVEWRTRAMVELKKAMNFDFMGVPVTATPELVGPRWLKLGSQPDEYRLWTPDTTEWATAA